jgi:site-specific DNA-methyltransferase (adenine-specific)
LSEIGNLKAYYKEIGIRLFLGDVITTLAKIPEESIDLIFADPPYNLSNGGFTCHAGKRVSVNKGQWDKSKGVREDFSFHHDWINACKRVLKPNGSLWISGTYHSIYACGFALQKQNWHIINDISWYKPNASPNLSCRMFTASHETLLWARKSKNSRHTFNYDVVKNHDWGMDFIKKPGKQMRSIWAINTPKNVEKKYGKHPTQKPEAVLERIILASSNKGDIVLDPFCGSSTTGVVALRHNRKFVGIDSEKAYLDKLSIPRLKDELRYKKLPLFESRQLQVREKRAKYGLLP